MHIRETFAKFFADRGTHLAAMIAYFALLSFVPLLFLALALLGLSGRVNESSYFVTELQKIFPGASISSIVAVIRAIQRNATSLGIVGGAFLLWSSLSLFSVLESAFNIVYGRPNRSFLHGKALAFVFMLGSLVTLFAGLLVGSVGAHLLNRFAPGFLGNSVVAYVISIVVSTIAIFLFLVSSYRYLTNATVTVREVLPGAVVATVALEATFQVLPLYVRLSKHVPAAQAFGGPALLLIWLYVMANVIVFGAEFNWRRARP
ncbi:MAG TPA: YihY/virulence factor BrkB family protein [Gaiellaceae bacterium]|nr:YihY/virulence factor BrkB family protein [Gaiellaceae bacterium]